MNHSTKPRALKFQPPTLIDGRYNQCEVCNLWFPEEEMEYIFCKDRCPECKAGKIGKTTEGGGLL